MDNSDTPETDAKGREIISTPHQSKRLILWKEHAIKLERERNEAIKVINIMMKGSIEQAHFAGVKFLENHYHNKPKN